MRYTISLDSTPDISNVVDFNRTLCLPAGPEERFIKFLDMDSHNSEHLQFYTLQDKLLKLLNENGIDIGNCRDQSYDMNLVPFLNLYSFCLFCPVVSCHSPICK